MKTQCKQSSMVCDLFFSKHLFPRVALTVQWNNQKVNQKKVIGYKIMAGKQIPWSLGIPWGLEYLCKYNSPKVKFTEGLHRVCKPEG